MSHSVWKSIPHIPTPSRRLRTARVLVDLITPDNYDGIGRKVTVELEHPWMSVALAPSAFRLTIGSEEIQTTHLPNSAVFAPGGTRFSSEAGPELPDMLAIVLDSEFAQSVIKDRESRNVLGDRPLVRNAGTSLLALTRLLRDHMVTGRELSQIEIESYAVLCFSEWLNELSFSAGGAPSGNLESHTLARIDSYIHENLDQDISLADLAQVAGLSIAYFLRAFKKTTGQTPHRHLMAHRIEQASQLLRDTKAPLSEISYACGFASQSHMSDAFKRHTQTTPGRYRKAFGKSQFKSSAAAKAR